MRISVATRDAQQHLRAPRPTVVQCDSLDANLTSLDANRPAGVAATAAANTHIVILIIVGVV